MKPTDYTIMFFFSNELSELAEIPWSTCSRLEVRLNTAFQRLQSKDILAITLLYEQWIKKNYNFKKLQILRCLVSAGLIGNKMVVFPPKNIGKGKIILFPQKSLYSFKVSMFLKCRGSSIYYFFLNSLFSLPTLLKLCLMSNI